MFNQAVVILSAGIKKNSDGKWVSTALDDFAIGAPGGNVRVNAAYYLWQQDNNMNLITSGGRGHDVKDDEPGRPDLSKILKDELIGLGVSAEMIIEENQSNNTFEQIIEISKLSKIFHIDKMIIVTNEYHIERVKAMIEYLGKRIERGRLEVVSAENICLSNDRIKWEDTIHNVYQKKEMKAIIRMEKKGTKQIKSGKYNF